MAHYPKGSEWRKWDLHIHSPASFHWDGEKFGTDESKNKQLIDSMIDAMNQSSPDVFCIMDYWTFDGWFRLKKRLAENDAPQLLKKVFPGIELRLVAPMKGRLNAHVIFSDEIPDQYLNDFTYKLQISLLQNRPLSSSAIVELARTLDAVKLATVGTNSQAVKDNESVAYLAGAKICEITTESYKSAIQSVPNELALGFMPYDTHDGLENVDWKEHYSHVLGLFKTSPIFESRKQNYVDSFRGIKTEENSNFFDSFFTTGLSSIPRLVVSGSDAHRFNGSTDKRGYGDFPSGKATWIKADPTWKGLLQAIKEPAKRSFIGERPPKIQRIEENKPFYINKVLIGKNQNSAIVDSWLDGISIELNHDLVAIIGNKGSGKSALADVISLLGNSKNHSHFSFLKFSRFKGKSGSPAKEFFGQLHWHSGEQNENNLNSIPSDDKVELVKYIPQGRFEALCNDHVAGNASQFEDELRSVIFSHIPPEDRQGALNFQQLIESQESSFRFQAGEMRKNLFEINRKIAQIEQEWNPTNRLNLVEQLTLKNAQLRVHDEVKPTEVMEPTEQLTPEQQAAAKRLQELSAAKDSLFNRRKLALAGQVTFTEKKRISEAVLEKLTFYAKQFKVFQNEIDLELIKVGVKASELIQLSFDKSRLDELVLDCADNLTKLVSELASISSQMEELENENKIHSQILNEPQQLYQEYLSNLALWQSKREETLGSIDSPDSVLGLEERIKQHDELPEKLKKLTADRVTILKELYNILSVQRNARAKLFEPLQKLILADELIHEEYKLEFQANLFAHIGSFSDSLFALVKQNVGSLRGEDQSRSTIQGIFDSNDLNSEDGIVEFVTSLDETLHAAAKEIDASTNGINPLMRKDRNAIEVYDHVYGLEYLNPKYTLLFQDTPIEQLSPGQRGALLLIFYLLVDKGRNPIILDQPEENLDNETIVSLLVPVLDKAKQNRQIIMVTHNPNLAVVCDAEQVIHAEFDRKSGNKITYKSGSIENPDINKCVVDILEGTKKAFDNRNGKYY